MFLARDCIVSLARGPKPLFYDDTFSENLVQQASYDLRLGGVAYVVGQDSPVFLSSKSPFLSIPPGQFALLTTFEKLDLPRSVIGFITLKNGMKMQGLVNISGFHVDPTFRGNLIFAVNNAGPSDIRLKYGDATFSIFFAKVTGDIGDERREQKHALDGISLSHVQYLGGSSVTLAKLHKEIEDLRTKMLIYGPLAVAALIALFVALLRSIWH